MKRQIFLYGHYGYSNIGDDSMAYVLIRYLANRFPNCIIAILSNRPIYIPKEAIHSVKYVPLKPFSIIIEIMRSSLFVLGGGTHFFDFWINKKYLNVGLERFLLFLLAKVSCKSVIYVGIGIEPHYTMIGKVITWMTLLLADQISLRDILSYDIYKEMFPKKEPIRSFDLATLLLSDRIAKPKHLDSKPKTLGISILPYFKIYKNDHYRDLILIDKISEALIKWLKQDENNNICIYVFKGSSNDDDVQISELLFNKLNQANKVSLIPYNYNPEAALQSVSKCSAFIGMRYHACLFAYILGIPLIVVDYFLKCRALAQDIGLSEMGIISIEDILKGKLSHNLEKLDEDPNMHIGTLSLDSASILVKLGLNVFDKVYL